MQCPQCGASLIAAARFCPVCGHALTSASPPTPIAPNPNHADGSNGTSIHDAKTIVMQRTVTQPMGTAPTFSAADVATIVADMGKSMVVSQWQRYWWKILVVGIVLYTAISNVQISTSNIFLLPQLFMIGTFLVPIVYTAYLYEDGTLYDVPLSKLALVFFFGGVIGCLVASLLLSSLLSGETAGIWGSLTLLDATIVGFVEELAKLVVVVPFLFVRRQFPTIMHGLVLGAAAGMGFAAFESMGYAFLALVVSGSTEQMTDLIRLRALLAPLGHGTWTAIIAAALWRERVAGRSPLSLNVLTAFLIAATLHALWDWLPTLRIPIIGLPLMSLILGAIGLLILRFFLIVARGSRTGGAYDEPNLFRALRHYFRDLYHDARKFARS